MPSVAVEDPIITDYNRYKPNGTSTVLIVIDSNLIGEEKFFQNMGVVRMKFAEWLKPFEIKFGVKFVITGIQTFTPQEEDSLDDSFSKVPVEIGWQFSSGLDDPKVNGNGYDWLIIYQENYRGGQNQANAVYGNALIIAHNQPIQPNPWTSQQLILLHEVGHLFGGMHGAGGKVDPSWFGNETLSFMEYDNLSTMYNQGWDKNNLPCDEENFARINASRFRFDLTDADADNLPNYYEYRYGLNANEKDSTADKDDDGLENLDEYLQGTDPITDDTDQDSVSDWAEIYLGTSPLNATDFPIVLIPIIVPAMENTTFRQYNPIQLRWRGVSSNPFSFTIYQNGSFVVEQPWEEELIQYQVRTRTAGVFNYTAVVRDQDGDETTSMIIITILPPKSTDFSWIAPLIAIYFLVVFARRRKH